MFLVQLDNNNYRYTNRDNMFKYSKITRFQKNLQKKGKIGIYPGTTQSNINTILNQIKLSIPNINNYSNIRNIHNGITICYSNNNFILNGSNIDLYSFLSNNSTLELLNKIKESKEKMSIKHYDTTFKPNPHIFSKNKLLSCPICIESIHLNKIIVTSKCNHTFHNECLKKWLTDSSVNNNCPSCRTDLFINE